MKRLSDSTGGALAARLAILTVILAIHCLAGCQSTPPPKPYQAPPGAVAESGRPHTLLSASEMAEAIRNGDITARELVEAHLKHIYLHNPNLNAIVIVNREEALKRADEADRAVSEGNLWGPLHGVPFTVKDHFAVKNLRTTNAHPDMAGQVTLFDATAVGRMKDAGAIVIGKTNLPYLGLDYQTGNALFGRTSNPWDLERTPGGGSGGGAAAVASGISPVEIAGDIGGCVRIPAHFTGVYSLKPTENTVSSYGIFPGLSDPDLRSLRYLLSVGIIARSMQDLERIYGIISGPDGKDPLVVPVDNHADKSDKTIDSLRIAWSGKFSDIAASESTRHVMETAAKKLSDAGSAVVRIDPDMDFRSAWKTWGELLDLQLMADQPRHMRLFTFLFGYSYRARSPLLQMVYPFSAEKYIRVLTERERLTAAFDRFMEEWDVFISPVAAVPAIEHYPPDAVRSNIPIYTRPVRVDERKHNYWSALGAYATPFNVTGSPVVTLPAGYTPDGLPVGIQIVGRRWHDSELIEIAKQIDTVLGAYRAPDGY